MEVYSIRHDKYVTQNHIACGKSRDSINVCKMNGEMWRYSKKNLPIWSLTQHTMYLSYHSLLSSSAKIQNYKPNIFRAF